MSEMPGTLFPRSVDPLSPAAFHKGSRSEPFVRAARPRAPHPPAYVAKLRKVWRVVVPVRGRLSPRVIARAFQRIARTGGPRS